MTSFGIRLGVGLAFFFCGLGYFIYDWSVVDDPWGGASYLVGGIGLLAAVALGFRSYAESIVALVIAYFCSGAGAWSATKSNPLFDQHVMKGRQELFDLATKVNIRQPFSRLSSQQQTDLMAACYIQGSVDGVNWGVAVYSAIILRPEFSVPLRLLHLLDPPAPDECRAKYQALRLVSPQAFTELERDEPVFAEGGYFRRQ